MRSEWTIVMVPLLLACGNKDRQAEPTFNDERPVIERMESDTVAVPVMETTPPGGGESSASAAYSSSSSHESDDYDNMRGFDPAFEDDTDDNGMSRYMENDDEEGWD